MQVAFPYTRYFTVKFHRARRKYGSSTTRLDPPVPRTTPPTTTPSVNAPDQQQQGVREQLRTLTDQCVLCGLCLPGCPTYRLARSEAESPRGRIALIKALAEGHLAATAQAFAHLESCLRCRACEAMCPSRVRYSRIHTLGSALVAPPADLAEGAVRRLLAGDGAVMGTVRKALHRYSGSAPQRWLRGSGMLEGSRLGRLERMLPDERPAAPPPPFTPARGPEQGRVLLYTGCTGQLLSESLIGAALRLLTRLGFGVYLPPRELCCGALDLHNADTSRVGARLAQSLEAVAALPIRALLPLTTACTAQLREAGDWLPAGAGSSAAPVVELTAFIEAHADHGLELAPLPATLLVHEPCNHRNVLKGTEAVYRLLARIPGATVLPLAENAYCCGAGGTHALRFPEQGAALRAPKLEDVARRQARYVVSTNLGCALHLAEGLRERGVAVEVVHPVELVGRLAHGGDGASSHAPDGPMAR